MAYIASLDAERGHLLLRSLFHVLSHYGDDPSSSEAAASHVDLFSLLSPANMRIMLRTSLLNVSIMSFSLFLFTICMSRCTKPAGLLR